MVVQNERLLKTTRQASSLEGHAASLLPLLADPYTNDVVLNEDGRIWVNRQGRFEAVSEMLPEVATLILQSVATMRGVPFNHDHPILETIFPLDGSRIEGIIPPVVTSPVFAIRLRPKQIYTLREYADAGILTRKDDPLNRRRHRDDFLEQVRGQDHIQVLELAVRYRRNLLVVGGTGSGKTTLLNGVIAAVNEFAAQDRIVIIEDTPELQCTVPNRVFLLATAHISQQECLEASLRLKPDRILVGEVRKQKPAQVLVSSWNTGHEGGFATLHANDGKGGLYRLEELMGTASARAEIARAIHLVVFIDGEPTLPVGRKVREILVVHGLTAEGDYECESV